MPDRSDPRTLLIRHGEDPDDVVVRIRAERPTRVICPFVVPRDTLDGIAEATSVSVYGVHDLVPDWDDVSADVCREVAEVVADAPTHDGWTPLALCAERIAAALATRRRRELLRARAREALGVDLEPIPVFSSRRVGRGMGDPLRRLAASLRHRTWPLRARRHRVGRLPGGTWAISSYVNYGRAMARAARHVDGIDGLLLLGPGGDAGAAWDVVVPGPAIASPAPPAAVEALRAALLEATTRMPGQMRAVVEGVASDQALLRRWSNVAAQAWAFFDRVRPSRVVVGNEWSVERVFAELAHRRGIPVVHVVHGLPQGLYRYVPLLADRALVWDDRWPKYFASETSDRIGTFDPLSAAPATVVSVYTSPVRLAPFASEELARAVLLEGAARLAEQVDLPLVVRLHPGDLPGAERRALRRLRERRPHLAVRVDRPGDPYGVLAASAVTVTAHSTVTAESASAGIPSLTVDVVDSDPGRWLGAQGGNVACWRTSFDEAAFRLRSHVADRMRTAG